MELKNLSKFQQRKVLVKNFVISNFNFCFLWNFFSAQSLNKIENIQRRNLPFFLNKYGRSYEVLLKQSGCPNPNLKRQRTLYIETYETLNKLNPGYKNDIFEPRNTYRLIHKKYKLKLEIQKPN